MKTDNLFFRLLQAQPTLAFELAGLTVPEPGRYGFRAEEVKQTAFRSGNLRNVVHVKYSGSSCLHVENPSRTVRLEKFRPSASTSPL